MIRQGLSLLAVLSMTACGSSSSNTATPTTVPTVTTPVVTTPTVVTPVTPTPTISATMSETASFSQAGVGQPFVMTPGAVTPITMVQTNTSRNFKATYDLTINGVTYSMTPDPKNSLTGTMNSHSGSSGGNTVSLFLNDGVPDGSILNAQVTDASGGTMQYFGAIGTLADPANLPAASATYMGNGEISLDKAGGAFDDAPATTVTFDADFAAGTLSGQFDVSDSAGENGGNFDIVGSTILPMTGTISGSQFTADVDYSGLVAITNGLNSVTPQPVTGAFFGTNGTSAVGSGLSIGSSTGTDDAVVYTRIQALQQ